MANSKSKRKEPQDVLYRIKRGLSAYVSYLAACQMNQAFSEYILYEPILRIFTARGYRVKCEYECPGIEHANRGDRKRIDFVANKGHSLRIALEVKWANSNSPDIRRDLVKLQAFLKSEPESLSLLCVFGRKSFIKHLHFGKGKFKERGKAVYADLRKTKYGCRIFQLHNT